ncbi:MAG: MFS transporter [Pseudomonadota bacterium]
MRPKVDVWRLMAGYAAGNFTVCTGALFVAGLMPFIVRDLGVTPAAAGQMATTFALTYAVSAALMGRFGARVDRRAAMALGLAGFAAGCAICMTASSFPLLLGGRVVMAIGASLFTPSAAILATWMVPEALRGRAMGLVYSGLSIAMLVGIPLTAWLAASLSWRAGYGALCVLAIGLAIILHRCTPPQQVAAGEPGLGLLVVVRHARMRAALGVTLFQTAAQYVFYTYLSQWAASALGIVSPGFNSLALLVFGIGGFTGNIVGSHAADRFDTDSTILASLALLAGALFCLYLAPGMPGVVLPLMAVWGLAGYSIQAAQQRRIVGLVPHWRAVTLSLNSTCVYLGIASGGVLGGLLLASGLAAQLPLAGAAFALLALWSLRLSAQGRQPLSLSP